MFSFLSCLLTVAGAAQATTYYVDDDGAGTTCTGWGDACPDLQTALGLASSGDQIWVATGTYTPTSGTDRTATFQLITGVAIYGGFNGTETSLGERADLFDQTILSGDIGTSGSNSDNNFHVVTASYTESTAVLDGFTITRGNANGSSPQNRGGGMYNIFSSPTVTNCTFSGNTAYEGGGMYNENFGEPTVTNCTFSGNTANDGGGMYNWLDARPTVTNCTFSGNLATVDGGGMYNFVMSYPTVTNCILWGDTGGEIFDIASTPTVTYSNVQGGYSGAANINADPLFVDADGPDDTFGTEDDNLRLSAGSPCIDAGNNTAVTEATDLDGTIRIVDGNGDATSIVDMGAYEFGSIPDNCNGNGIPDMCDLDCDALGGDCNVPDCGLSSDDNANGIPDECDCPELAAPAMPAGEAGYEKTRYISMVPGDPGQQMALRVTLTSLPIGFSTYEDTQVWVGEPVEICENSGQSTPPPEGCGPAWVPGGPALTMWSANLQATRYCHDFGSVGLLHVTDCEIVPGATYTVEAIHCDCDPGNEENYSDPLTINTSMWGDICNTYDGTHWTAPNGTIDVTLDVTACLEKFKNTFGAPIKARANVDPNVPGWKVNISTDVTQILDAFKGQPYPFAGPGTCPP